MPARRAKSKMSATARGDEPLHALPARRRIRHCPGVAKSRVAMRLSSIATRDADQTGRGGFGALLKTGKRFRFCRPSATTLLPVVRGRVGLLVPAKPSRTAATVRPDATSLWRTARVAARIFQTKRREQDVAHRTPWPHGTKCRGANRRARRKCTTRAIAAGGRREMRKSAARFRFDARKSRKTFALGADRRRELVQVDTKASRCWSSMDHPERPVHSDAGYLLGIFPCITVLMTSRRPARSLLDAFSQNPATANIIQENQPWWSSLKDFDRGELPSRLPPAVHTFAQAGIPGSVASALERRPPAWLSCGDSFIRPMRRTNSASPWKSLQ
jgi:hypothetical protein